MTELDERALKVAAVVAKVCDLRRPRRPYRHDVAEIVSAYLAAVDAPASPPRVPPTPEVVEAAIAELEKTVVALEHQLGGGAHETYWRNERTIARAALLALYVPPSVLPARTEAPEVLLCDINALHEWVRLQHFTGAYRRLKALCEWRLALIPTPETRDNG